MHYKLVRFNPLPQICLLNKVPSNTVAIGANGPLHYSDSACCSGGEVFRSWAKRSRERKEARFDAFTDIFFPVRIIPAPHVLRIALPQYHALCPASGGMFASRLRISFIMLRHIASRRPSRRDYSDFHSPLC